MNKFIVGCSTNTHVQSINLIIKMIVWPLSCISSLQFANNSRQLFGFSYFWYFFILFKTMCIRFDSNILYIKGQIVRVCLLLKFLHVPCLGYVYKKFCENFEIKKLWVHANYNFVKHFLMLQLDKSICFWIFYCWPSRKMLAK